jgi:hypothetical protein
MLRRNLSPPQTTQAAVVVCVNMQLRPTVLLYSLLYGPASTVHVHTRGNGGTPPSRAGRWGDHQLEWSGQGMMIYYIRGATLGP